MSRRRGAAIAAAAACALALGAGPAAAEQGPDDAPIEVEAARVELDRERGEVLFAGAVVLRHGQLELRCERMRARTGEGGRLVAVEAEGDVRLVVGGAELRAWAGSACYDPGAGRLVLGGAPRVQGPSGTLTGRAITIDARTGRVTIEEAHGVFRLR